MSKIAIKLEHVSKSFDVDKRRIPALDDINLDVKSGEFFTLLGPSGSGKSTLLRIMSGLEKDFVGNLSTEGMDVKDFGFVFQQFGLLPWMTVYENVEMGLTSRKDLSDVKKKEIIRKELASLGLDRFEKSYPRQLSGGQRQRVGIARALVANPKVIFMDEPFSELDSFTAEELRKEILKIWHERKITVVMVTHRIDEALELSDRIAVLTSRPGHIERVIINRLPRPRDMRSKNFFDLEDLLYRLIKP